MPKQKLDHQTIAGLDTPDKPVTYYDTVEKGLMIRLSKAGSKTFCYRYRFNGKKRRFTIGSFPAVSLSDARKKVQKLKGKIREGIDPQAERERSRRSPDPQTFKELANDFKDKHLPTLRDSTRTEYERIIDNELIPVLGKFPINEISRNQIINLLDDKAYKEDAPTMANRIRARLSTIFSFGIERGLLERNPVQNISTYKAGKNKRERYYNEEELKKLWQAFGTLTEPAQSVLKMLLITGQRKSETSRMKWEDIRGDIWTIPAEVAKNSRPHDVPLSPLAKEIIERMRSLSGDSDYVFESPKLDNQPIKGLKRAVKTVKEESGVSDFRPHDLRRTVATYMAKMGIERTVLGKILNHKGLAGDGQVTAIYDRHSYINEKRQALNRWTNYLGRILESETETNIHKIG